MSQLFAIFVKNINDMKKIPYGISNFERIIREDYYFVDKTMYIPQLEDVASYVFFLRPRRFGKSVFVDMLESYYDIYAKDKFDELFGNLWIGHNPTWNVHRFQVLRFDFSQAVAPLDRLEESFNSYCNRAIDDFIRKYRDMYDDFTVAKVLESQRAGDKLVIIQLAAKQNRIPLYLIIDEYDNFTNIVLGSHGKETFHKLTHAEGFYRDFFKILKPTFDRIIMIGVSPVTMDDLTSGYNIGMNISQNQRFNSMLGFNEEELRKMIEYYREEGAITRSAEEVLDEMRPWYNNYCFAEECCGRDSVYNSTMALYYLNSLVNEQTSPRKMLDPNTRTDYNKLRQLIDIDRGIGREEREGIIMDIANKETVNMELVTSFPALAVADKDNFLSLVFYYGMLSMESVRGLLQTMVVPNQSVRLQYWDYVKQIYERYVAMDDGKLKHFFYSFAFEGDWEPLLRYLGEEFERVSSVRDSILGEHNVQGFFKAYLAMSDYHILCPEIEMNYGYSDFLMIPQLQRFPEARHSYLVELKYAKPSAPESEVERLSEEADRQLERYLSDRKLVKMLDGTTLHPVKIVFHGPHMAVCCQM